MVHTRIEMPATGVKSLCWNGDTLVDWVSGGVSYTLDGFRTDARTELPGVFDAATVSPSGRYAAVYQRTGTEAIILDQGRVHRRLTSNDPYSATSGYPILLFALPDGREVLAHCPEFHGKLEIEDVATGERLTQREGRGDTDFFHSGLAANASGTWLISVGWFWGPREYVAAYHIPTVLSEPSRLDVAGILRNGSYFEDLSNAAFLEDHTLVTTYDVTDQLAETGKPEPADSLMEITVYDLADGHWARSVPLEEATGLMMPVGPEHVIGFYKHPRLISVATGRVLQRWPGLNSGRRTSCLHTDWIEPTLALDPAHCRFAVADAEKITVVLCEDFPL